MSKVFGYYITKENGDILTSARNPNQLEWTPQFALEERHKKAVLYKNPYHISARVKAQIEMNAMVFKIVDHDQNGFVTADALFDGECVGVFASFNPEKLSMNAFDHQFDQLGRPIHGSIHV